MSGGNYMTQANAIASALRGRGAAGVHKAAAKGSRSATEPSAPNLEVLAFMRSFFADNDQLPPVAVVSKHFGWSSTGAAEWHIQALIKHGLLQRNVLGKLKFARRTQ